MDEKNINKEELAGKDFQYNPVSEQFEYTLDPIAEVDYPVPASTTVPSKTSPETPPKKPEDKETPPPEEDFGEAPIRYSTRRKKDEVYLSEDALNPDQEEPKSMEEMFEKNPLKAMNEIEKKMQAFKKKL